MMEKSPLTYALVRNLSCLDPQLISDTDFEELCSNRMRRVLTSLSSANQVRTEDCDEILLQYEDFMASASVNSKFRDFGKESPDSTLDTLYFEALNAAPQYKKLWKVVKTLLVLSHGQASVERGFSVNKEVEDVNLTGPRLIARRLVKDHIRSVGGLKKVTVGKEMLISARGARQNYVLELEQNKEKQRSTEKLRKRKHVMDDVEEIKRKKRQLEDIKTLSQSANNYADKAESQEKLTLIAKANSLRKSADEKRRELEKVNKNLDDKVMELRNM